MQNKLSGLQYTARRTWCHECCRCRHLQSSWSSCSLMRFSSPGWPADTSFMFKHLFLLTHVTLAGKVSSAIEIGAASQCQVLVKADMFASRHPRLCKAAHTRHLQGHLYSASTVCVAHIGTGHISELLLGCIPYAV